MQTRVIGQSAVIGIFAVVAGSGEYLKYLNKVAIKEELDAAASRRIIEKQGV
jgi:hypothetical protein